MDVEATHRSYHPILFFGFGVSAGCPPGRPGFGANGCWGFSGGAVGFGVVLVFGPQVTTILAARIAVVVGRLTRRC